MIPDTVGGALTLSLVNLFIVFFVLILLALIISLMYKVISSFQEKTYTEVEGESYVTAGGIGIMEIGPEVEEITAEVRDFESLDSKRKAAIIAAVCAYMDYSEIPVFIRGIPDAGAWGKTSRSVVMNE